MLTLDEINAMAPAAFVAAIGDVFEHAPWIAAQAEASRPFATVTALHEAMFAVLEAAPRETRLAFLKGHPDLAGSLARSRALAAFSADEQSELGLDRLDDARFAAFEELNASYRARFDMPFLICVRRHTRASILQQFARRLASEPEAEFATAMVESWRITRLRIAGLVTGPGMPATSGWLSTHVLDTAAGKPIGGARIELFELDGETAVRIEATSTNADGRTDAPLLSGGQLRIGQYEIRFHIGRHFGATGGDPPFLDIIPIRFAIAEPEAHYHVPLLVSPFAYATYRGS